MKLENVKLIHTEKDIPINYNSNENFVENIFIFNSKMENISGITFTCPINFDKNEMNQNLMNKKEIIVENIFLFYSFMYQIAFGHYVEQVLPKINYYLNLKKSVNDLKFCIPKKRLSLITKDIIKLLNISDEEIIILDHDTIINSTNLYYNNYECADFNKDKLETFNLIREKLLISKNNMFNRNVYIKRNTDIIINNDCFNIGKTRQIINENTLIEFLKQNNFEIITLGEHDLHTKKELLSNINILITQSGGAMYNLVFSNTPKHIIFLSNKTPLHIEYIHNLLPLLNCYTPSLYKVFLYDSYI